MADMALELGAGAVRSISRLDRTGCPGMIRTTGLTMHIDGLMWMALDGNA